MLHPLSLHDLDSPAVRERLLQAKAQRKSRVVMIAPAFNEAGKIERVVDAWPRDLVDTFLITDDGTTDGSTETARAMGATVLATERRQGIGIAIRRGLDYAKENKYDIAVIIAGNGKDDPAQVHRLLYPLLLQDFDYVQGSRYLEGGHFGKMPKHRQIVTRVYPLLLRIFTRRQVTDGTNGFRAYWITAIEQSGANLHQDWLAECLEYYLAIKFYRSKLRLTEAPVSKLYPQDVGYQGYTKVRTSKMHHRLKPLFYLTLGLRR